MTVSKTSTEGTPDNRSPPLEDDPIYKGTPWLEAGKISGNLVEEGKDWLLPPNYLDNNSRSTTSVTSLKPPIKEEPKTEEQPSTGPKAEKCGRGLNCPFCKTRKKKTWMEITRSCCSRSCSPNRRFRWPKQCTPRLWITRNPRTLRNFLTKIWGLIPKPIRNP